MTADVVAATASRPDVERGIHSANVLLYIALGWYDAALDEVDRAARTFPNFVDFRRVVEQVRDKDTVSAHTDFPAAPD